jgi:putative DNA primase/helicase
VTAPLTAAEIPWRGGTYDTPATAQEPTDARWAERFAEVYADTLRWDHSRGHWLVYRPPLWRIDGDGEAVRLALKLVRDEQARVLDRRDDQKTRARAVKDAIDREGKNAIDRMLALSRNLRPLADRGTEWDLDPLLLGAPNGIIDLRTGRMGPGDPSLRITQAVGVPFLADATCPRWLQFLDEIFEGDDALIAFVWRFVGYSLTGLTIEQVFVLCCGTGANGKTTFLKIVAYVFGEYGCNLPFTALEMRGRSSIPNDIAALIGRRLATASETSEGTRLNEARLKALTGGDPISARFLFKEAFQFQPTAKFMLAVNHKPLIADDSYGFWRRLMLVPFLRSFIGSARDNELDARLRLEGPGILQWAVAGCLAWQRDGLQPPDSVRVATEQYREESDPIADFLAEACAIEVGVSSGASAVQVAYSKWADVRHIDKAERLSKQALAQRLADRFARRHTKTGWVYDGLRVATDRMF